MNSNASASLQRLIDGNQRFLNNVCLSSPQRSVQHAIELQNNQQPFAIILTCSDSRVSPEIIFDQGLGHLYIVRIAGNVVDNLVLGSIEYAVIRLNVPLIVVMGHSDCSAVKAAINDESHSGNIMHLLWAIKQTISTDCDTIIHSHIINTVKQIQSKLRIAMPLTIIGAYYNLQTGAVEFLNK